MYSENVLCNTGFNLFNWPNCHFATRFSIDFQHSHTLYMHLVVLMCIQVLGLVAYNDAVWYSPYLFRQSSQLLHFRLQLQTFSTQFAKNKILLRNTKLCDQRLLLLLHKYLNSLLFFFPLLHKTKNIRNVQLLTHTAKEIVTQECHTW